MSDDTISRAAAIDEIARWIGYLDEDMIYRIQTGLKKLPSADPEAEIVKVLKMVEEYKEKTGTDEIIIMPKNGMKAWDENGVEYTMQPTCNKLETDCISRQGVIDVLSQYPFEKVVNCISIIEEFPSAQTYKEEQIQKMQDLEQAQLEEAYRRGRESAQPKIGKLGLW